MKRTIYLFLLTFCLVFLISCTSNTNKQPSNVSTTEETTLSDYEQGFERGYEVGFSVSSNYAKYFYSKDAQSSEKPTSPNISSINGSSDYLKGYDNGYSKGLDDGYIFGFEEAEFDSQIVFEDSALQSIIAEHPFVAEVINDAEDDGYENGWCEGYDEGYSEGYDVGWDDGYDDAIEWSESE